MIELNSQLLFINADTTIELAGLHNEYTGTAISDATVTAVLSDPTGDEIYTFSLLAQGSGNYLGTIPVSVGSDLIDGETYTLDITATNGVTTFGNRQTYLAGYREGK